MSEDQTQPDDARQADGASRRRLLRRIGGMFGAAFATQGATGPVTDILASLPQNLTTASGPADVHTSSAVDLTELELSFAGPRKNNLYDAVRWANHYAHTIPGQVGSLEELAQYRRRYDFLTDDDTLKNLLSNLEGLKPLLKLIAAHPRQALDMAHRRDAQNKGTRIVQMVPDVETIIRLGPEAYLAQFKPLAEQATRLDAEIDRTIRKPRAERLQKEHAHREVRAIKDTDWVQSVHGPNAAKNWERS
jgi:hypothetical protein